MGSYNQPPCHKNPLSVTALYILIHSLNPHIAMHIIVPYRCCCCYSVVAPTTKKSILNGKQFFHNKTISFSVVFKQLRVSVCIRMWCRNLWM